MAATLPLILALGGCAAPAPKAEPQAAPLRVTNGDAPFANFEGAAARKRADTICGIGRVKTSIYDRYDNGAWVYPEGCA